MQVDPADNGMSTTSPTKGPILFTRDADGAHPIHVLSDGYRLVRPPEAGGVQVFESKRQLLIAVTGHPKARNWTFDRYFRQGRHDDPVIARPQATILDWFNPVTGLDLRPVTGGIPGVRVRGDERITISEVTAASLAIKASEGLGPDQLQLGIDLINRSHEVAKLLFSGFGQWIHTAGYDPEEVLQEVYVGILVRNKGTCPWDGRKSSFGHYVHMVCNGVLSNYHRKTRRVRDSEQPGAWCYDEHGEFGQVDVSQANLAAEMDDERARHEMEEVTEDLLAFMPEDPSTHLARQILSLVREGYTKTDIARLLGVSRTLVAQSLEELQRWATDWHHQLLRM